MADAMDLTKRESVELIQTVHHLQPEHVLSKRIFVTTATGLNIFFLAEFIFTR